MTNSSNLQCPCSSGKSYTDCCKPFHEGTLPQNALLLMRSRFAAYALNLPKYIIATTHPGSPHYSEDLFDWKKSISTFSKFTIFHKLEILDFKEFNSLATVTFTAFIEQDGKDATFTENSTFELIDNRWFYRNGKTADGQNPNLVPKEPLKQLPLAYYGEAVLRQIAEPVPNITNEIKELIEQMVETMDAFNGLGIAAPQVHQSLRIFIMRSPKKKRKIPLKIFINPKISKVNDETWVEEEGCLSIPGMRANVTRAKKISVEFTDVEGNTQTENYSGWEAKIIQHENDHIDGILYIDHLDDLERAKLEPFLKKLKKRLI